MANLSEFKYVLTYIKIKEGRKKKDSTQGYLANPSLLLLQVAEVIPVIMLCLLTCLTKKTLSLPQQMIGRNNYDITLFSFKYLFTSRRGGKRTSLALFLLDMNSL